MNRYSKKAIGPRRTAAALLAAVFLVIGSGGPSQAGAPARTVASAVSVEMLRSKIKHVFVLYQENRSFDSYFGTFPGAEGLYSHVPQQIPGFSQVLLNTDGSAQTVQPFRIGPEQFAADTDDVDHAHSALVAKMDIVGGVPQMDRFALTEERKYSPSGNPSLKAKQFGELTMAHEDCDTIPFLWGYAKKFVLLDHVFQTMTGPSTPGNLAIIGAQTGITQALLHPEQGAADDGDRGPGVPVVNDADPFWGSPSDKTANPLPVNPRDFPQYETQRNLTYATLPLTLAGRSLPSLVRADTDPTGDLMDVANDVRFIGARDGLPVQWGWYEEGYDREVTDDASGPIDAAGRHASYVTHHNGPGYFGYVANNAKMRTRLHGLGDLFDALKKHGLSEAGGVYYVKGGYHNVMGLRPSNPDPAVQKAFVGDDDHPGYSDAQISEALVAKTINEIARSPYWKDSAIVLTWDDSEGDYDHVRPPLRVAIPGEQWISDGPRVPLIVISPYARTGAVVSEFGEQGSVVKFVDELFGLPRLANLPDERRAAELGYERFGLTTLGPTDADGNGVTNLFSAFDAERLAGRKAPLPASYAEVADSTVSALPQDSHYGCKDIGVIPTDVALQLPSAIPSDFNPRPKTVATTARP